MVTGADNQASNGVAHIIEGGDHGVSELKVPSATLAASSGDIQSEGAALVQVSAKKIVAGKGSTANNDTDISGEGIVFVENEVKVGVCTLDDERPYLQMSSIAQADGGKAWKEQVHGNAKSSKVVRNMSKGVYVFKGTKNRRIKMRPAKLTANLPLFKDSDSKGNLNSLDSARCDSLSSGSCVLDFSKLSFDHFETIIDAMKVAFKTQGWDWPEEFDTNAVWHGVQNDSDEGIHRQFLNMAYSTCRSLFRKSAEHSVHKQWFGVAMELA